MQTKLTLETDYKINGKSTGTTLDTLAIAVDGRDSNDISEYDDYRDTEAYVLDNYNYEADMLKGAPKDLLKIWLNNPEAQAAALDEYKDERKEAIYNHEDDTSPLAKAVQKAIDDQADQNYKEWLHGDYRNWAGILRIAERKYGNDDGIKFTEDKGEVYVDISEDIIDDWAEDGSIKKTLKAAKEYLEYTINQDARAEYNKREQENAKRKEEYAKTKAYQAERAKIAEEVRQSKIKSLIAKAK